MMQSLWHLLGNHQAVAVKSRLSNPNQPDSPLIDSNCSATIFPNTSDPLNQETQRFEPHFKDKYTKAITSFSINSNTVALG